MSKLPKIKKNIKGFAATLPKLNNLPAKIPKQGTIDLRNLKKKKKFDKMFEEMIEEKRVLRKEKAKKIAWKKIDDHEYEIFLGGRGDDLSIGNVRRGFSTKWTIHPTFLAGKKSYRYNACVNKEYYGWHEASHAMIDLWIVT
tara:strand:+ start:75 stop:500 length:426 start_codon:yes stop_codon:yes gene_type:complete